MLLLQKILVATICNSTCCPSSHSCCISGFSSGSIYLFFILNMKAVKDFYKETPFNFTENLDFYVDKIKNTNQILEYKDLHQLLRARLGIVGTKK